jgi:hypothetical protein
VSRARALRLAACNRRYGNVRAIYDCEHPRDHAGPHENHGVGLRWVEDEAATPGPCPWGCARPDAVTDGAHLCDGALASSTLSPARPTRSD